MTAGCFHVDRGESVHVACAAVMIPSVRQAMPGVRLVQFSDETSPPLDGVDAIVRMPAAPLGLMLARHYRACLGDWLFLDTDVVIQQDVQAVFADTTWDLAVAARAETSVTSREFWRLMPYNCGVLYSRCPAFWGEVTDTMASSDAQDTMTFQQVTCDLIATGRYRIRVLPPTYNYAPHLEHEEVSAHAVVHYKGNSRKHWMLDRARAVAA